MTTGEASPEGPEFVEIGTARDAHEGGLIRAFLAGYDIDCFVQAEHHSALLGGMGTGLGCREPRAERTA